MRRPTHVRKRDGRVVPFDEGKIADAIYRAALAVGGEDRFLAEELASMVTLFLVKTMGPGDAEPPGAPSSGPALPGMDGAKPEDGRNEFLMRGRAVKIERLDDVGEVTDDLFQDVREAG